MRRALIAIMLGFITTFFSVTVAVASGPLDEGCENVTKENVLLYHKKILKLSEMYYLTHEEIKTKNEARLIKKNVLGNNRSEIFEINYGDSLSCLYRYGYVVYEKKYTLELIELYIDEKFICSIIFSNKQIAFYDEDKTGISNKKYRIIFDHYGFQNRITTLIGNKLYITVIYGADGEIKSCNEKLKK